MDTGSIFMGFLTPVSVKMGHREHLGLNAPCRAHGGGRSAGLRPRAAGYIRGSAPNKKPQAAKKVIFSK